MHNILLLAYQCSPFKGSEFSVAWNYIINMSSNNHLFVIYGVSGEHLGDNADMENFLADHNIPNVDFIFVKPNRLTNALNFLNRKGFLPYSFYLAYNNWHRQVYHKAKELIAETHIDIIHYLTPIGYREPGYLWKLNKPYIWGPVGGTVNYPLALSKYLSLSAKLKYSLRNSINSIQLRLNHRIKNAVKKCDVLLTATSKDQDNFDKWLGTKALHIPENCILKTFTNDARIVDDRLNVVFIGRIDGRKNLGLLCDALFKSVNHDKIHLHIIGDGPDRKKLESHCYKCGLSDHFHWYGQVPRERVYSILNDMHLLAITSLCEGNPTTIWEALSFGIPIITLDHCGMHDTVSDKCGFKISIDQDYYKIVNDFAAVLDKCVTDKSIIRSKSIGAIEDAQGWLWTSRRLFWEKVYNLSISNYKERQI